MDCRTTSDTYINRRFGFKKYDVILTKEQPVLTRIMSSCKGENMQTQYNVLGYGIDLYLHHYKIAIEIDENEHSDKSIDYEIKRQKTNSKKQTKQQQQQQRAVT